MWDFSVCCIKGCDLPTVAVGLCNKHWRRNKKYGSPVVVESHSGMFVGKTALQRFEMQYKVADNGCWLWTTSKDKDGYGMFRGLVGDVKHSRAHRFSWAHHNNQEIPKYANICHSCDTPSCVNPAHLWPGTPQENQTDKWSKGRGNTWRGEQLPQAKLTELQVREILADPTPFTALAAKYGVSSGTISDIKRRYSWAHLDVENVVRHKRTSSKRGRSDKINEDAVRDIRTSTLSGLALAAKYGISPQQVCGIRKRRAWAHVE